MSAFEDGVSELLALFREHGELTRSELTRRSGLSRTAVTQRVDALVDAGLLVAAPGDVQTKGRPADSFRFHARRGFVLAADMGVTKARVGVCDLVGDIVREEELAINVAGLEPEVVMEQLTSTFDRLLEETGISVDDVRGIGVSVPAPVKIDAGFSVSPPIMPTWNRFDVPAWLSTHYSAPALLEKDANVMAYGEARMRHRGEESLMFVKIGTGIGSGFVFRDELFRGSDGAAGDLGHTLVETLEPESGPLCKCGNRGCLEAYAGGWAMARDLEVDGEEVTQQDLVRLIRAGDPRSLETVRRSGRLIGNAIATAINLVNPRVVVVGGRIAEAGGDHLFAGIREMVYRRSLPLATSDLRIERSALYPRGGLIGLTWLVVDSILSPRRIGELVTPRPRGVG